MATQEVDENTVSSGVDALIERLRDEGVTAGRNEADKLLADARAEAKQVLDKANADARARLETARMEADAYLAAGQEALKTAMRDTLLDMRMMLMERFSTDVKRLMGHELQDKKVLRRMILEVAGRTRDGGELSEADDLEFILPAEVVELEELRNNPEQVRKGKVTEFVLGLTSEMLRQGISFSASEDVTTGIRVQVKGKDIEIDLTEEAVAVLLLQHLQPRFRAILEGVVK